jgi:hypothetical protein
LEQRSVSEETNNLQAVPCLTNEFTNRHFAQAPLSPGTTVTGNSSSIDQSHNIQENISSNHPIPAEDFTFKTETHQNYGKFKN